MDKSLRNDIKQCIDSMLNIYKSSCHIMTDLEELIIQNENVILRFGDNNNGSNRSRHFSPESVSWWLPQYITRYYKLNSSDRVLGIGIQYIYSKRAIDPLLIWGIFTLKDKKTATKREEYYTDWLQNAWFKDGIKKKELNEFYKFKTDFPAPESFKWYESVSLKAIDLTDIKCPDDIKNIFNDMIIYL